ncbi:MAG: 3D domain-containing protein [Bacillota bacterium]
MNFLKGKSFLPSQLAVKSLLILILSCGFLFGGMALAFKTVTVTEQGKSETALVLGFKVENALQQLGIVYFPEDLIIPAPQEFLKNGMEIEITRAEQVFIEADNEIIVARSINTEPESLLAEAKIQVGDLDLMLTGYTLAGFKTIKVVRITEKVVEEQVAIPFTTFRQPDHKLRRGEQKLLQSGQDGLRLNEIKVTLADGEELEREIINSEVLAAPVRQVIAYGINEGSAPASRSLQHNVKEIRTMEATAYTHTGNRTATGIYPYVGVVAVDPRVIPLGSKLYVEGYGYAEAQDTGGAIKGDRIDIFLDTEIECINWGRRVVEVHFLE